MKIYYKSSVKKDIKNLDPGQRADLVKKIELKLLERPSVGKKLVDRYERLFSLLVGNYRVVYFFIADGVLVLRIGFFNKENIL